MYDTRFKGSFKAVPICVYKPCSNRKRTLGSISCNTTTSRSLQPIPPQLSAFGVAPGLRLIISNYRTSLALFLPRVLVPSSGQRRTTKSSLGKTTKPTFQSGQPTLWSERTLPCPTPRTQPQNDSSRVKPRSVVSWQATPSAVIVSLHGTSMMALVQSWSVIVSIES